MKYTKLFLAVSLSLLIYGGAGTVHAADPTCTSGTLQPSPNTGLQICFTPVVAGQTSCPTGTQEELQSGVLAGCQSTPTPAPTTPAAPSFQSGCYDANILVAQPNFNTYPGTGCPPGSSPVGTNGVGGSVVNGNLSYIPLEPLSTAETTNTNFCGLINIIFKLLIYLGGAFAVLALVIGGISYMVSEVVNKKTKAKARIQAAVYGLLLLIGSWLILNTVNPQLVSACNVLAPANSSGIVTNAPSTPANNIPVDQARQNLNQTQNQIATTPDADLKNTYTPAFCSGVRANNTLLSQQLTTFCNAQRAAGKSKCADSSDQSMSLQTQINQNKLQSDECAAIGN